MRYVRNSVLLVCSWLLLASSLLADQKDSQSPVTFTARTELVSVPVVVADKSGNHVSGLTKGDFELRQDGKTTAIASFEEIKSTTNRPSHAVSSPGVFTNELSNDPSPKRLTIFALDLVNTPFMDQAYARQQLLKFLANRVSSQEPIALIAIRTNGIKILHDFTSDPAVLVAALRQVSGEIPAVHDINQALFAETEGLTGFANGTGEYVAMVESQAILITLECFQHVAEAFAGVPGRKSLIWATAGFPFALDPSTGRVLSAHSVNVNLHQRPGGSAFGRGGSLPNLPSSTEMHGGADLLALEPVYRRTLQMLSDASISVYPVDARGLIVFFPGAKTSLSGAAEGRAYAEYKQAMFESTRATMVDFAEITGGRAFYNRNDLDVAFQKSADDSASYYLLGYYLEKDTKPGWHKLQVRTKRGGVEVQARQGFFVTPQSDKAESSKMDLKMALASPLDYTGVPLSVRWAGVGSSGTTGAKKNVHFEIILPAGSNLVDTSNDNNVDLEVVAVAQTATGNHADQFAQRVQTNVKPDKMGLVQRDGLNYANDLQVPPGSYWVRFVVRNNLDGRMGSVTAPLQVTP
jgi:VWFA-related protein